MLRQISIVLADEQPVVHLALRTHFANQPGFRLLPGACSLAELEETVASARPDVVVSAVRFRDGSLLHAVPRLVQVSRILVFSGCQSWMVVQDFLSAGASGFVSKKSQLSELATAIEAIANNGQWVSPAIRSVQIPIDLSTEEDEGPELTLREREIVALIVNGYTSKEIADLLCVSLNTVETHRYRIFKKLKIKRIVQLASFAIKNGIVV